MTVPQTRKVVGFSVPPETAKEIEAFIAAGDYGNRSEWFREAFRAWKREKQREKLLQENRDINTLVNRAITDAHAESVATQEEKFAEPEQPQRVAQRQGKN